MMRPEINYYALLGVCSTATPEEIIRAYRKKILEVHLDKISPGEDSDQCYRVIEAYRILSNRKLRTKYDIQRDPSYKKEEKFVPFGYICYNVGQNQLSKKFLKNISNWKEEFQGLTEGSISDNYFECFSSLMGQVLDHEEQDTAKALALRDKEEAYGCPVCDKEFRSETLHWEEVLHPYITMFSCDNISPKGGISPLLPYFERLLTPSFFNWEPRSLPTAPLGIWGKEWDKEWEKLDNCDTIISRILAFVPPESEFPDTEAFIDYIGETFLSDSEVDEDLFPDLACRTLIFILENQEDQPTVLEKVQNSFFKDEIREILYLVSAMKNYLGCGHEEWVALAQEAVDNQEAELAVLWTKIAIEFSSDVNDDAYEDYFTGVWYKLGMKLYKLDPLLAHFCFLYQGYGEDEETAFEDWNDLGDDFCDKEGDHLTAINYYLYANLNCKKKKHKSQNNNDSESEEGSSNGEDDDDKLLKLLNKSKMLTRKGDKEGGNIYKSIYYSLKCKTLLSKLQQASTSSSEFEEELEQLIDLIDELDKANPLEGYRIISTTWPKAFESPICQGIHKGTIAYLRRGKLTTTAFNFILGALHFLPDEGEEDEEEFEELQHELCSECNEMVKRQIERSMKTSDFDLLGDILSFIGNGAESRCLPGAEEVLRNIEEDKEKIENSPHLKAMKLLIEGTVMKIKRDWLQAMNLYQEALLCSPECMHRVLPCISKLSQDIQFHEAILSQVHSEIKELKDTFDLKEYPEVDRKKANNRNSLLISDVEPKVDFGYKNSMSKIQQSDPAVTPPQPPEEDSDPPPIETNTPLVTLDKTEEAIGSGKDQGQLNAALSYIDLLKALPLPFQPGPIVMAASHFLRAMDESGDDPSSLFAYRNAIMQMAESLLKIDRKTQASIQHGLTHKPMLSILLAAHEKMSKALRTRERENEENSDRKDSPGTDLIKTTDAHLISKFLKNVVNFPKIEPLANIPTLNCSDLVYVETLGNSFLSRFCKEKMESKHHSPKIPKHLHSYTSFVEIWKGRSVLTDFSTARAKMMEELLAARGLLPEDVEGIMMPPLLNLTDDGWSSEYRTELLFPNPGKAFRTISGFKMDSRTGRISFLLSKDKQNVFTSGNLFDVRDFQEIFSNGIEPEVTLSLDSPDLNLRSHPFKEARFSHATTKRAPLLFLTMARSALLLCYFSSGLEICGKAPFHMKPTDEGLLLRLEEHLQHILRPAKGRKDEEDSSPFKPELLEVPNRFWLNLSEVFEEEEEESSSYTYKVGEVKAHVKMNTLILTLNGAKASLTPEAEFAKDFTKHFDEIGKCFPELLRLKELVKLTVICRKLKQILREKASLLKQNGRGQDEKMRLACCCNSIRELGISLEEDEDKKSVTTVPVASSECNWVPASFCNNLDAESYEVSAGVRITPEVTYFPVSMPKDCLPVNAKELFAKKKLSFVRRN